MMKEIATKYLESIGIIRKDEEYPVYVKSAHISSTNNKLVINYTRDTVCEVDKMEVEMWDFLSEVLK